MASSINPTFPQAGPTTISGELEPTPTIKQEKGPSAQLSATLLADGTQKPATQDSIDVQMKKFAQSEREKAVFISAFDKTITYLEDSLDPSFAPQIPLRTRECIRDFLWSYELSSIVKILKK